MEWVVGVAARVGGRSGGRSGGCARRFGTASNHTRARDASPQREQGNLKTLACAAGSVYRYRQHSTFPSHVRLHHVSALGPSRHNGTGLSQHGDRSSQ